MGNGMPMRVIQQVMNNPIENIEEYYVLKYGGFRELRARQFRTRLIETKTPAGRHGRVNFSPTKYSRTRGSRDLRRRFHW